MYKYRGPSHAWSTYNRDTGKQKYKDRHKFDVGLIHVANSRLTRIESAGPVLKKKIKQTKASTKNANMVVN